MVAIPPMRIFLIRFLSDAADDYAVPELGFWSIH
jgi:hypothetical protein